MWSSRGTFPLFIFWDKMINYTIIAILGVIVA